MNRNTIQSLPCREVLRLKSFWFLSTSGALRHMVTEGVSVHFVILLVDRGWSTAAASSLLGLSTLDQRAGAHRHGLARRSGRKAPAQSLACSWRLASRCFSWAGAAEADSSLCPVWSIYSLAYGGLASLQEPIRADYFGTKAFATIQGVSRTVTTVGTFLGPVVAGFCYDSPKATPSRSLIFAVVSLGSAFCMFLAKPPMRQKTGAMDDRLLRFQVALD